MTKLPSLPHMAWTYCKSQCRFFWHLLRYRVGYVSDEVFVARLERCMSCPLFMQDDSHHESSSFHYRCSYCGCPVEDKARRVVETCPLSRWKPLE